PDHCLGRPLAEAHRFRALDCQRAVSQLSALVRGGTAQPRGIRARASVTVRTAASRASRAGGAAPDSRRAETRSPEANRTWQSAWIIQSWASRPDVGAALGKNTACGAIRQTIK